MSNEIDEVTDGSVFNFSAHGVPKKVAEKAASRDLVIYDATCPLVRKGPCRSLSKMHKAGCEIIMIGRRRPSRKWKETVGQVDQHVEVSESAEQVENLQLKNPEKVAYVSQTTISHATILKLLLMP